VIPPLVALLKNLQTRPGRTLPFGRKPERNWIFSIRDAQCAGLEPSRSDPLDVRRHLHRLLVSLHRAMVSRLPARDLVLCETAKEIAPAFR
jgi:hypothetical protein